MSGQTIYAYVGGNPLSRIDPTGEIAIPVIVYYGAAALVGAVIANNAARGGSKGKGADDPFGGATGARSSSGTKSKSKAMCDDDDNDDCKQVASDWDLEQAGIDAHEAKKGLGSVRLFEICKCKSGGFAVKRYGCQGPIIYRL